MKWTRWLAAILVSSPAIASASQGAPQLVVPKGTPVQGPQGAQVSATQAPKVAIAPTVHVASVGAPIKPGAPIQSTHIASPVAFGHAKDPTQHVDHSAVKANTGAPFTPGKGAPIQNLHLAPPGGWGQFKDPTVHPTTPAHAPVIVTTNGAPIQNGAPIHHADVPLPHGGPTIYGYKTHSITASIRSGWGKFVRIITLGRAGTPKAVQEASADALKGLSTANAAAKVSPSENNTVPTAGAANTEQNKSVFFISLNHGKVTTSSN